MFVWTLSQYVRAHLNISCILDMIMCLHMHLSVCMCVYPQCAEATESLQHAVVYVFQSVGGQNQLIDP